MGGKALRSIWSCFDAVLVYVTKFYHETYFFFMLGVLIHDLFVALVQLSIAFQMKDLANAAYDVVYFPDDMRLFDFEVVLSQGSLTLMLLAATPIIETNFFFSQLHILAFTVAVQTHFGVLIDQTTSSIDDNLKNGIYPNFPQEEMMEEYEINLYKSITKRGKTIGYTLDTLTAYLGTVFVFQLSIFICIKYAEIEIVLERIYPFVERVLQYREELKQQTQNEREADEPTTSSAAERNAKLQARTTPTTDKSDKRKFFR